MPLELRHILTPLIGTSLAAFAVSRAITEYRRFTVARRLPLVAGANSFPSPLVGIGWLLAIAAALAANVYGELVPRGSAALFAIMFGWVVIGGLAALFAHMWHELHRSALGWLTMSGDDTLIIEAEGRTRSMVLRPGSVRLRYVPSPQAYAQFDVTDGEETAHFWGMVPLRDLDLVTNEHVQPRGPFMAIKASALCRWIRPFVAEESR